MSIVIEKKTHSLGDGSEVFNVRIWDEANVIVLPAITETDADLLIRMLAVVIETHTNETVEAHR